MSQHTQICFIRNIKIFSCIASTLSHTIHWRSDNFVVSSDHVWGILHQTYLLTYLPTYSMQQSPSWEANRFSASQETPRMLWNPKVHYRIHKCPPPVPILSQLDPVHTPTFHFLKIHLNIILPSTPGSPKWSLFLRFPHQNPTPLFSPYALHVPPISFFSILSPEQYWARSTDHSAPHYVVFSGPLLSRPS